MTNKKRDATIANFDWAREPAPAPRMTLAETLDVSHEIKRGWICVPCSEAAGSLHDADSHVMHPYGQPCPVLWPQP